MVGKHNEQTTPLSDSICSGLQIANFCQDVRRDAARGRIYLPKNLLGQASIKRASILSGGQPMELRHALGDWSTVAREMLRHGLPLVTLVPRWLARDLQLFIRGGLYLLDELERNDYDSWTKPSRCPSSRTEADISCMVLATFHCSLRRSQKSLVYECVNPLVRVLSKSRKG